MTQTKPNKSRPLRSAFPIVGIGASAGGLAAFNELLAALPPDTGMAFVLVQHLDPTHTSMLAEALSRATAMKVATAADGTEVEPDHVYVIPPNTDIALEGGSLVLVPREKSRKPHLAIDFFFRSLAAQRGAQAIGVVLSGSGSDGTEGLRAIKAEGGITFAQEPKTATFGFMPESAINAGVVDGGMPVAALAKELVRLSRHPYLGASAPPPASGKDEDSFEKILAMVRNKTGVDFSEYKRATIQRRTARRMALLEQESLDAYFRLLQTDDAEARALCEDVLIHVTSFFREPAAFEALANDIFPQILAAKTKGAPLRAWVAGCSTGEEVYSLAISLLESAAYREHSRPIQIFGTDLSEKAVEKARAGVYSDTALRELGEEIRRKYFVKLEHGYRINKQVRELCVFVRHDLARDPPFARLDLVCCRNVLIYFGPELQRRLVATFHFCLNQPGFLVLGRSESIPAYSQFFTSVDRENKIYARTSSRSVLHFAPSEQPYPSAPNLVKAPAEAVRPPFDLIKHVDRLLLARYAPAGVVLNEKLEVLQFRGRTGPYLEPAPGQPQTNVLKMAREGLLLPLKSALAQARKQKAPVRKRGIEVGERGATVQCDIVVTPLSGWPGSKEPLYAVMFEDIAPTPEGRGVKRSRSKGRAPPELTKLRRELHTTKEYLQSLLEEHSRVNDDLGTANEELISGNEELQSMNEELQTAKEELQSANEELTTLNDELQSGNRELNLANSDLINLLNTVEFAIVFLDAERRIRRYTPQAQSIFNLLPTDIGRPIDDIKTKLSMPDLDAHIAWSIANVAMREREVQDQNGRWYRKQIRPYVTVEGKVDGAILSLVDIDVLKRHADEAESARDYAVSVVDAVLVPLVVLDEDLNVISANDAFYESFGGTQAKTERRSFFAVAGGEWDIPALRTGLKGVFGAEGKPFNNLEVEGEFPRVGQRTMSFSARSVHFRDSRPMILLAIEDVSARKQVDAERKRLLAEAQAAREEAEQANRTKDAFLATLSHELRTPLATMLMNAQLLRHADLPTAKVQRASEAIERSALAQSKLIEDLLDVSRIVTGKLSLDLRRLGLPEVVRAAIEGATLQAERKHIRIEAVLDEQAGQVSGDFLRLQQVVSNLLTNAIKFTPEHGEVKVVLGNEGDDALLRVSDTGSGIEPDFLPFVFDRFTQQENSSVRRYGGLGLGLSIVRHIVEMHGGKVRAESPGKGRGSTFSVTIPLLREPQDIASDIQPLAPVETRPAAVELSRLRGLRVLVVDDDAETLEAVTEMLRLNGASVIATTSAAEALKAAQESRPEVIVSDIAMPGTDGYSLIRAIRALPAVAQANVPAIALTAAAGSRGRELSLKAGFQEHLEKPVDIGRLARALVDVSQPRHSA